MATKLDKLRERGVVRDEVHSFSDLVFAEGMRQIHPDRVFVDVGGDDGNGPYLQTSQGDAARLEAEGYRLLTIHPKELALLSSARRAAGYGIRWGSMMTPMCTILPLAAQAGVVSKDTKAEDLLDMHLGRGVRIIGKPGGQKRIMIDQLVSMAAFWSYASRRLEPENGWGPADMLPENTRAALDAWTDSQLLEYVNAQQKTLGGALRLALALSIQGRARTGKGTAGTKSAALGNNEKIKREAERYRYSGRNHLPMTSAAQHIAKAVNMAPSTVQTKLSRLFGRSGWNIPRP
jgi:hypothetical protein